MILVNKRKRKSLKKIRRTIVYYRDLTRCRYCGTMLESDNYHIDHIIPISKGGNDYYFNLALACDNCNLRKGNREGHIPQKISFAQQFGAVLVAIIKGDFPSLGDWL